MPSRPPPDDFDADWPANDAPPRRKRRGWFRRLLVLALVGCVLGAVTVAAVVFYYSRDLPKFDSMKDYDPPRTTRVFAADGSVAGEIFLERRTVVPMSDVPAVMVQAIISAEDANFFEHSGVDWVGIAKAFVGNLRPGAHVRGASTLTQQTVKTFLLSSERSYARKIKEAILALRLEQNLSKQDILHLYLNQIFFGNRRYGIEEAARYYFGKGVKDVTLAEAAALASIPKSPTQLNPRRNARRAKERQVYVLQRMVANGFITAEQAQPAIDAPLPVAPLPPEPPGGYYVSEVRRQLVEQFGEERVMTGGLRVETMMMPSLQATAEQAVQRGLRAMDKRQGYRGPAGTLPREAWQKLRQQALTEHAEDGAEGVKDWRADELCDLRRVNVKALEKAGLVDDAVEQAERAVTWKPRAVGEELVVRIAKVSRTSATVDLCTSEGTLPLSTTTWARKWGPSTWTPPPKSLAEVFEPGDLVLVRVAKVTACDEKSKKSGACEHPKVEVALEQMPLAEGALVAIDPTNRGVIALVGGYDFRRSFFNRATQAKRQSGSAYKPLVFGAALEQGQLRARLPSDLYNQQERQRCTIFTNRQTVFDTPELIRDPWTGKPWQPRNYERDVFDGPMSLRKALAASKNTVAVKLVAEIGCEPGIALDHDALLQQGLERVKDFSYRLGIDSRIPDSITTALGSGEVTPMELTNAYATLAMNGRFAQPVLIKRVLGPDGEVLADNDPVYDEPPPLMPDRAPISGPKRGVRAAVAFVTTELMRSVVEHPSGTARSMQRLGRPIAGKTGTANEQRDAWFVGFTPEAVTGVWTGFDNHDRMGSYETGGHAAGPIWMEFMEAAEATLPHREFEQPAGVVTVQIDPRTGLLADAYSPYVETEVYLAGTEPTEVSPPADEVTAEDFLRGGGP